MTSIRMLAWCLLCGMYGSAYAQPGESRGALLYATHCNACHNTEIHWRNKRLATDWESLVVQVQRWQGSINLYWRDEEIADVAHHLNVLYYSFPEPGYRASSQKNK
ncbi:MAG: hypothetical protein WC216_09990 [Gallionella sp.]